MIHSDSVPSTISSSNSSSPSTASHSDDGVPGRDVLLGEHARRLQMRTEDLDVFLRAGFDVADVPAAGPNRLSMLAYLRKRATPPPKWVMLSGLWPELDASDPTVTRRKKIRALYKAVVLLIRRELKRVEVDEFRDERTVFWDPVVEVCRELEIAQSKLSSLCKELTGNSLIQVVDSIRAERLLGAMRVGIRAFVAKKGSRESGVGSGEKEPGACLGTKMEKWRVWKSLKASRKWPEFSQNSWALGMGFCSYRRLYRACLVVYRKTPHQLEMELIEEALREVNGESAEASGASKQGAGYCSLAPVTEFVEMTLEEIERRIREIGAYEVF